MPNTRAKRNSVVDMLSKVHVNRGSLLKGIENLLKTIESSESAVMIPTLLRDKCEFDAWELLFVAKILKASILGHSDLVEFYMNHMGNAAIANQNSNGNTSGSSSINGNNDLPSPITSPGSGAQLPTSPSLSSTSSISSVTANGTSQQQQTNGQPAGTSQTANAATTRSQSSMSSSWITASQASSPSSSNSPGNITTNGSQSSVASSSSSSSSSSSCSSSLAASGASSGGLLTKSTTTTTTVLVSQPPSQDTAVSTSPASNGHSSQELEPNLLAARPLLMRQAQPPSLLQLTTTNNHINSVASAFSNNNIEQLTNQLLAMQLNGNNNNTQTSPSTNGRLDGALSISTTVANQQSANASVNGSTPTGPAGANYQPSELRTSRSAGCLFRINSGASSPRTPAQTPTTPYPQAETLANGHIANGLLAADPGAPVKLLLQIEQLKTSINQVTSLLESVVELYKKSIDNIA